MLNSLIVATALAASIGTEPPPSATTTAAPYSIEAEVRGADARFWDAFNRCNAVTMATLFTDDAEFYHDRTGLKTGAAVARSMMEGPCADPAKRLRREPIPATIRFFPLAGDFAILEGEHRFLVSVNGEPETHDSVARFSEVWQRTPGSASSRSSSWQMRRVLSFDHHPDTPVLKSISLSPTLRRKYVGKYRGNDGAIMTVGLEAGQLHLRSGRADFPLVPLGRDRFGTPGRWLLFTIVGKQLTVVEEGRIVATAQRAKVS